MKTLKIKLESFFFLILRYCLKLVFDLTKFNFVNVKKKRVLIYTDSRGTEIDSKFKVKNPFFSYVDVLTKKAFVDYQICKKKHTSILDFLCYVESNSRKYDLIYLHCGIVDFAPRPRSSYDEMLGNKIDFISKQGWESYFLNRSDVSCFYQGEPTFQFMSREFVEDILIEKLESIGNIVYISINPVINDWRGNYWRERPTSINKQLLQDSILRDALPTIDFSEWSKDEIMKYTIDNIHYTKAGVDYLRDIVFEDYMTRYQYDKKNN